MSCSPVALFEQAVSTPLQRCPSIHLLIPIEEHPLRLGSFVQGTMFLECPCTVYYVHLQGTFIRLQGNQASGWSFVNNPSFYSCNGGGAEIWNVQVACLRPLQPLLDVIHPRRTCQSCKVEETVTRIGRAHCPLNGSVTHEVTLTGTQEHGNPGRFEWGLHGPFLEHLVRPKSWYPLPPWPSWWGSNVGCSCGKVRILQIRKFWTEGVCPQFACYPYSSLSLPNAPILSIDAPLTQDHPSHMEDLSKLTTGCSLVDP